MQRSGQQAWSQSDSTRMPVTQHTEQGPLVRTKVASVASSAAILIQSELVDYWK